MSKFDHILGDKQARSNDVSLDHIDLRAYTWKLVMPDNWRPCGERMSEVRVRLWNYEINSTHSMEIMPYWNVITLATGRRRWYIPFQAVGEFDPSGYDVAIHINGSSYTNCNIKGEIAYVRITDQERIAVIRRTNV